MAESLWHVWCNDCLTLPTKTQVRILPEFALMFSHRAEFLTFCWNVSVIFWMAEKFNQCTRIRFYGNLNKSASDNLEVRPRVFKFSWVARAFHSQPSVDSRCGAFKEIIHQQNNRKFFKKWLKPVKETKSKLNLSRTCTDEFMNVYFSKFPYIFIKIITDW